MLNIVEHKIWKTFTNMVVIIQKKDTNLISISKCIEVQKETKINSHYLMAKLYFTHLSEFLWVDHL